MGLNGLGGRHMKCAYYFDFCGLRGLYDGERDSARIPSTSQSKWNAPALPDVTKSVLAKTRTLENAMA